MENGLGRRVPTDFQHIEKYPIRLLSSVIPDTVEKTLSLPSPSRLRRLYDQGSEGACVGFAWSWAMSIINHRQSFGTGRVTTPIYDPLWLYRAAQLVDDWSVTPPESGTSVRAAGDILRDQGHIRVRHGKRIGPSLDFGIAANRWATTVDEMRQAIAFDVPVVIGVNWYRLFDSPVFVESSREYVIPATADLGRRRGGHAVCVYGASDRRQAFKFVNNWGMLYPLTWMPYAIMSRLLAEYGEAALITDR